MPADRERPLSPHLQIYRLPLNAVLSISHRLTGIVLALGAALVVFMLMAAAAGSEAYRSAHAIASHWTGLIVLFLFTLALFYHLCAGIRHLVWDAGYGYSLDAARRGSLAVLAGAAALTVLTWLLALSI
jgi:succinate dehydrogenase / fumarate reductase, cytochrome b subunit